MKLFGRKLVMPNITPAFVAFMSLLVGVGMSITGVYLLAGIGWAVLIGASPFLLLAFALIRGLLRVQ